VEENKVAGAACPAIGRAELMPNKLRAWQCSNLLVLPTFLTGRGWIEIDFLDPCLRIVEKVIDMPS